MREKIEHKKTVSRIKQNEKYKNWVPKDRVSSVQNRRKAAPIFLTDYVINLSSVALTDDEVDLLNKGLNFAIPPAKPPVEDLCIDVMSSVRKKPAEIREDIENNTMKIMRELLRDKSAHKNKHASDFQRIIKSLREKKLVILKRTKATMSW